MNAFLLMVLLGSSTHLSGEPGEVALAVSKLFGEPVAIGLDRAIEEPVELKYVPGVEGSDRRAVYRAFESIGLVRELRDGREAFRRKSYPQLYPDNVRGSLYAPVDSRHIEFLEAFEGRVRLKDGKSYVTMKAGELSKVFPDLGIHWFLGNACFTVAFDSMPETEFLELVALSIGARVEFDEVVQIRKLVPYVPAVKAMWIGMRDDRLESAIKDSIGLTSPQAAKGQVELAWAKHESSVALIQSLTHREIEMLLEEPKTFIKKEVRPGSLAYDRAMVIADRWINNIQNTDPDMVKQEKSMKQELLELIDFSKPLRANFCLLSRADVTYPTSDPKRWVGL